MQQIPIVAWGMVLCNVIGNNMVSLPDGTEDLRDTKLIQEWADNVEKNMIREISDKKHLLPQIFEDVSIKSLT